MGFGYTPTPEQQAVIDAFAAGEHVTVTAYAGAGKTSVLVEAAKTRPMSARGLFTAFNKKIVTDSAQKFPATVDCRTTHSLATSVAHQDGGWRWKRMDSARMFGRQLALHLGINDPIRVPGTDIVLPASRLASIAKMMVDRFATSADDTIEWWHLPAITGIDSRDQRKYVGSALAPAARRAWADLTRKDGKLRYEHNYYRKEYALTHPSAPVDFVFVDEAQDSAGVLVGLVQDWAKGGTQVVTVGDSFQAINGWAGAVDAMNQFGGTPLHLSQSFRFGDAIAAEAQKWLTLLGATIPLRGNPAVSSRVVADYPAPEAILARTNGTVVQEVLHRLTAGQKVAMLGKPDEILAFTRGSRDLMQKGYSTHPDLMAFQSWGQLQEYVSNDGTGADLKVMVDTIDKHGVDVIETAMGRLSTPWHCDVLVSTAHKCKGAEWGKVRIADDFKAPKPDDNGRLVPDRDAAMLAYVAVTRAKEVLDRGSLKWVDEAVAGRAERPAGVTALEHAPTPVVTVAEPERPVDGDLDDFVAAVKAATNEPRLSVVAWCDGRIRDGELAGFGRGAAEWVSVTGPVGTPTVLWHRYRTLAAKVAGLPVLSEAGV